MQQWDRFVLPCSGLADLEQGHRDEGAGPELGLCLTRKPLHQTQRLAQTLAPMFDEDGLVPAFIFGDVRAPRM